MIRHNPVRTTPPAPPQMTQKTLRRATPPSLPWLRIRSVPAGGSPEISTLSSRGAFRFIPSTRAPTASTTRPSTKPRCWAPSIWRLRATRSVRYNTDLILDLESTGGRGLSQALGLAGFTNLDVVRNPNLGSAPYLARYGIHQVIGLTQETADQQPGPFALAATVPLRRIEFRIGKLTLPDFFDVNGPGSDSHLQFMNWTVDNNGAWDYAADTRGYTVGAMAEYDDRVWSIRYGLFAMPTVANGIDMDWALSRAHAQNGEFELRHSLVPKHNGTQRVLFFANRAHMGSYREAVQAFLNGVDPTPNILLHEHFSALKYGFGFNFEQEITGNLRVFGRFGWNEGQHESYRLHRSGPDRRDSARTTPEPAGTGPWTRSDWPSFQTPSSAIIKTICATAGSAFCSATAISTTAAKPLSRVTTTCTPGAASSTPSMSSTSTTPATTATAAQPGSAPCAPTWISDSSV